jgi:hypothetical protein
MKAAALQTNVEVRDNGVVSMCVGGLRGGGAGSTRGCKGLRARGQKPAGSITMKVVPSSQASRCGGMGLPVLH